MPRATKDSRLDTATARARLAVRRKPHYRLIEPGLHVGYYRGTKGGSWIARRYVAGRYETGRLALADDGLQADGTTVMTFGQAQVAARVWATSQIRKAAGIEEDTPWTVAKALDHYLENYTGKARKYIETTLNAHVRPTLGEKFIRDLSRDMIRRWHHGLANAPARLRTSATADKQRVREINPDDDDARRARKVTANAVLTLLRAALNLAFTDEKVASDMAWRRVRPFKDVDAPRVRYLTDDEALRLVNACSDDMRQLVTGALLTGARYQEVATLRPVDVDLTVGVVTVRAGKAKGGKQRSIVLTAEAVTFFERQMTGKQRTARLFERDEVVRPATKHSPAEVRRAPWGKSHQFRPLRAACKSAHIVPPIAFHELRHTYGSRLAMKGVPLQVIAAQLGHGSTRITERHYAHISHDHIVTTVRSAFTDMGLLPTTNVTPIRHVE